jgi:hypothetical protein
MCEYNSLKLHVNVHDSAITLHKCTALMHFRPNFSPEEANKAIDRPWIKACSRDFQAASRKRAGADDADQPGQSRPE